MTNRLGAVAELATEAARAALPESVVVGDATLLPRGADPFVGSPRPLLLAATRWAVVSPGGVLVGGNPAGLATMFGFDVPDKPAPVPPEARKQGDPPPPKWADLVAEEARSALTTFSHAVANAVITLSGLPHECAPTQLSVNDSDLEVRGEVGPISDAVVLLLHCGGFEARVVVVIPGIFLARMNDVGADNEVVQVSGGTFARPVDGAPALRPRQLTVNPLDAALAKVPLDLSIELGRARVPLAKVLHLADGEVLELRQAIDAPVDLVCESFTVARGDLEVDAIGNLVLLVTSVPGGPRGSPPPQVIADLEPEAPSGDTSTDEAPGQDETPEPLPVADEASGADEAPAVDEALVGEDVPVSEDIPVGEDVPVEQEAPPDEEATPADDIAADPLSIDEVRKAAAAALDDPDADEPAAPTDADDPA